MIIDEAQNLTPLEVKTIVTRVGNGTKIIFTATRIRLIIRMLTRHQTASTTLSAGFATRPSPRTSSCRRASAPNWRTGG